MATKKRKSQKRPDDNDSSSGDEMDIANFKKDFSKANHAPGVTEDDELESDSSSNDEELESDSSSNDDAPQISDRQADINLKLKGLQKGLSKVHAKNDSSSEKEEESEEDNDNDPVLRKCSTTKASKINASDNADSDEERVRTNF